MSDLRCYCCGKDIGPTFWLASMQDSGCDRVFIMRNECIGRADTSGLQIRVRREPAKEGGRG